jgi:hypothetical protein
MPFKTGRLTLAGRPAIVKSVGCLYLPLGDRLCTAAGFSLSRRFFHTNARANATQFIAQKQPKNRIPKSTHFTPETPSFLWHAFD